MRSNKARAITLRFIKRAGTHSAIVRLTLRTEPRGGSVSRSRRGTPPAAIAPDALRAGGRRDAPRPPRPPPRPPWPRRRGGRGPAVTLGGLLSRLGRRACGSPPRRLLCGVRPPTAELPRPTTLAARSARLRSEPQH